MNEKYSHIFDLCFSVDSPYENFEECLAKQKNDIILSVNKRVRNIFRENDYLESIGHVETFEQLELNLED